MERGSPPPRPLFHARIRTTNNSGDNKHTAKPTKGAQAQRLCNPVARLPQAPRRGGGGHCRPQHRAAFIITTQHLCHCWQELPPSGWAGQGEARRLAKTRAHELARLGLAAGLVLTRADHASLHVPSRPCHTRPPATCHSPAALLVHGLPARVCRLPQRPSEQRGAPHQQQRPTLQKCCWSGKPWYTVGHYEPPQPQPQRHSQAKPGAC